MKLTVSPHAMWGLKVSLEEGETISENTTYKLILDKETKPILKNPNKCNEFINQKIQEWIIANGFNDYPKRKPVKFTASLNKDNTIVILKKE